MIKRLVLRSFGAAGILAGVMIVLARITQVWLFGDLPLSVHGAMPLFVPLVGIPGLIGSILFLLAVTGLYLYQSESAGYLGLLAFIFAFVGLSLSVGANWTYAFGSPYLVSAAPAVLDADFDDPVWGVFGLGFLYSYLISGTGYLVFCISTIVVGKVPRWIGITMILSMVCAAILPISTNGAGAIVVNILLGIGPFIFGLYLWRESEVEVKLLNREQPNHSPYEMHKGQALGRTPTCPGFLLGDKHLAEHQVQGGALTCRSGQAGTSESSVELACPCRRPGRPLSGNTLLTEVASRENGSDWALAKSVNVSAFLVFQRPRDW